MQSVRDAARDEDPSPASIARSATLPVTSTLPSTVPHPLPKFSDDAVGYFWSKGVKRREEKRSRWGANSDPVDRAAAAATDVERREPSCS